MQIRVGRRVTAPGPASIPATLPGAMPALGTPSLTRNITLEEVENDVTGEPRVRLAERPQVRRRARRAGAPAARHHRGLAAREPHRGHAPDPPAPRAVPDRRPHAVRRRRLQGGARAGARHRPRRGEPGPAAVLHRAGRAARANERGWKDTVRTNPGQVTRIRVRWTLPAGVAAPQRYVFHCHILEHEDNSMMRPARARRLRTVRDARADCPGARRRGERPVPARCSAWRSSTLTALPYSLVQGRRSPPSRWRRS